MLLTQSQDAHDLWVQHCWLGPQCAGGDWEPQPLPGRPCHGERAPEDQLQHQAADRAGEGVPLQQVPDAGQARGGGRRPAAERDAGEGLVSEQTHEAEEIAEGRSVFRAGARGPARTRGLLRTIAPVLDRPRQKEKKRKTKKTPPAPELLSRTSDVVRHAAKGHRASLQMFCFAFASVSINLHLYLLTTMDAHRKKRNGKLLHARTGHSDLSSFPSFRLAH